MNKIINLLTKTQNWVNYVLYYLSKERQLYIHFNTFWKAKLCVRLLTFGVKVYPQITSEELDIMHNFRLFPF